MLNKAPAANELKPPFEHKESERPMLTERYVCEAELASEHEK